MIILASSSPTRANLLKNAGIEFRQISFDFDESKIAKSLKPEIYAQNVVKAKKEQFLKANGKLFNLLFADSCVACGDQILGKERVRSAWYAKFTKRKRMQRIYGDDICG